MLLARQAILDCQYLVIIIGSIMLLNLTNIRIIYVHIYCCKDSATEACRPESYDAELPHSGEIVLDLMTYFLSKKIIF